MIKPKHSTIDRSRYSYVGSVKQSGFFVRSGSVGNVVGSTTGSITLSLDAVGFTLKRVEVFHSGGSNFFNFSIENKSPNSGSEYDPRRTVVQYCEIPGSTAFNAGIDQVEELVGLTDYATGSLGSVYLHFMPHNSGNNWFKYLLFFEAAFVYVNKDGDRNI